MFQNFIDWSLEPPPDARRCLYHGHQAKAFTAALWSVKQYLGCDETNEFYELSMPKAPPRILELMSQMQRILSLPPLASCYPSGLHFKPHTSWRCPKNVLTMLWESGALISFVWIWESIEPLESKWLKVGFQSSELILPLCCSSSVLIF